MIGKVQGELEQRQYFDGPVYAEYETAAAQSIADNTITIVDLATKVKDTHNAVTVGASWAFTCPVPGPYWAAVCLTFKASTAWAAGEYAQSLLYVNGALKRNLFSRNDLVSGGTAIIAALPGNTAMWLNYRDTVDIRVYQHSGGSLALFNSAARNWVCIGMARAGVRYL